MEYSRQVYTSSRRSKLRSLSYGRGPLLKYWWVNQNETYAHEVGGGYLWSPKKRSDGAINVFYENMLSVQPGDIVFSFAGTMIKAIGVAFSTAYISEKPKVFGNAGENWSKHGWRVGVEFTLVSNPIRPKDHMSLIGPLLPEKYSPLQQNGNGLQGVYLAALTEELGQLLLSLSGNPEIIFPALDLSDLAFNQEEQDLIAEISIQETVKASLIEARRGQGVFRNRVRLIERQCRVTGVTSDSLLIASHIKPWKESDNQERLEGNNGLFLSPHVDKLFDRGFISLTPKGDMLVSPSLEADVLSKWNIDPTRNYGRFNSHQSFFLEYHNKVILIH
jgi:putative restriction endonuclease